MLISLAGRIAQTIESPIFIFMKILFQMLFVVRNSWGIPYFRISSLVEKYRIYIVPISVGVILRSCSLPYNLER